MVPSKNPFVPQKKPSTPFVAILFLLIGIFLFSSAKVLAQKPGFIYTKATNGGNKVMDPNNDGFVSLSSSGFIGGDIGSNYSEIPYRVFPQFGTEPLADVVTGANGGHTDLAEPPLGMYYDGQNVMFRVRLGGNSTASKGYSYFFDTDGIFNGVNAVTGEIILYKTPSKVINLGFEFEVVFASNFDVRIYKHTGSGDDGSPYTATQIWTGNLNTYSQKAVAFTTSGGDADHFYEFFVPLSAFQGGFTASTKLRLSGSTVTSAQSGLTGTISDIGGIDDKIYANDAKTIWKQLIPAFPLVSLTDLQNGDFPCAKSLAPVITSTVKQYDSSVSGTSAETNGTIIRIYSGGTVGATGTFTTIGTLLGSGTVNNGSWTVTLTSAVANIGDVIRATATSISPQKCESNPSAGITSITGFCNTPSPAAPTLTNGSKGVTGTYSYPAGTTSLTFLVYIRLPNGTLSNSSADVFKNATSATSVTYAVSGASAGTQTYSMSSSTGNALTDGTYVVSVKLNNGCESAISDPLCVGSNGTGAITVNAGTEINKQDASVTISGTYSNTPTTAGATFNAINFYVFTKDAKTPLTNGPALTLTVNPATGTTVPYTITIGGSNLTNLAGGDILSVRAIAQVTKSGSAVPYCTAIATNTVKVNDGTTAAPIISSSACLPATGTSTFTIKGTSTELGSTITLYNNGSLLSTASGVIVNGAGHWSTSVTATAPFSITARAKASNKVLSPASGAASISSQAANTAASGIDFYTNNFTTFINSSNYIFEGTGADGAVYGKVPVPSNTRATVKVYLNKDLVAPDVSVIVENNTASSVSSNWSLTALWQQELYVGGLVTATVTYTSIGSGGTSACESNHLTPSGVDPYSNTVTLQQFDYVQCQTPPAGKTVTWQASGTICHGSKIAATITNSEFNVLYQIQRDGINSGDPVVGTGFTISVFSGAITSTSSGIMRVVAIKNNIASCQTILNPTQNITAYTLTTALTVPTITVSAPSVCKNGTVTITVTNPVADGSYQLYKNGVAFGSAVTTNLMPPPSITFPSGTIQINTDFYVIFTNSSTCTATSATSAVTVKGPSLTQKVAIDKTVSCSAPTTVTISVNTENNSSYTYQVVQVSGPNGSNISIGSSFTGDGSVKTIRTTLTNNGTYTFKVTVTDNAGTGCGLQDLITQVTAAVAVDPAPANANSTDMMTVITTNTILLSGSDPFPGTGIWTIISQPSGSMAFFSDATHKNATVYGLISGSYDFRWTVTNTCTNNSTSGSVLYTVNTNSPATYSVNSPDYINRYTPNKVLATASDVEGFNNTGTNFILKSGSALPPGTALDAATGNIFVTDPLLLVAGDYSFNVLATDKSLSSNRTTDIPILMSFEERASSRTLAALPVELFYFRAVESKGKVLITWATASEINNSHFTVERSADGKNFVSLARVNGVGNSNHLTKYSFTDVTPLPGISYYRLKQEDLDGTTEFSKIAALQRKGNAELAQISAFPNPANHTIQISIINASPEVYVITLFDMIGNKIADKKVSITNDDFQVPFDLTDLPAGTYLLKASSNHTNLVTRIVKQ